MYCRKCGKKIPSDSEFCPFCGAIIRVADDKTDSIIQEEPLNSDDTNQVVKRKKRGPLLIGVLLVICCVIGSLVFLYPSYIRPVINYQNAKQKITNGQYREAIEVLEPIISFKDSEDYYYFAIYEYASDLLNSKRYSEASGLFTKLFSYPQATEKYPDAKSKYLEAEYQFGCQLYNDGRLEEAIEELSKCLEVENATSKLNDSKFGYVLTHQDYKNEKTYEYLQDLIAIDYSDAQRIYQELYRWSIFSVSFSSSSESLQNMTVMNGYDPIYIHFTIAGGPPNSSTGLYAMIQYPDGSEKRHDLPSRYADGSSNWIGWENGLYKNGSNGQSGNLIVFFYDDKDYMIGQASVFIEGDLPGGQSSSTDYGKEVFSYFLRLVTNAWTPYQSYFDFNRDGKYPSDITDINGYEFVGLFTDDSGTYYLWKYKSAGDNGTFFVENTGNPHIYCHDKMIEDRPGATDLLFANGQLTLTMPY